MCVSTIEVEAQFCTPDEERLVLSKHVVQNCLLCLFKNLCVFNYILHQCYAIFCTNKALIYFYLVFHNVIFCLIMLYLHCFTNLNNYLQTLKYLMFSFCSGREIRCVLIVCILQSIILTLKIMLEFILVKNHFSAKHV